MAVQITDLEELLKEKEDYSLEELKEKLLLKCDKDLYKLILKGFEYEFQNFKYFFCNEINDNSLIYLDYLLEIVVKSDKIDSEKLLVKINEYIHNIKQIKPLNIKENINIDLYKSFIKNISDKLKSISMYLKSKEEQTLRDCDYIFLEELVYNIKDTVLLKEVFTKIPKIVLAKDNSKNLFYENLVNHYIELVKTNDQKNMLELLYFEFVIEEFLNISRSNFAKVNKKLTDNIGVAIESVKRKKESRRSKDRSIFFLDNLRSKLKNVPIKNKERELQKLNYKYEKTSSFPYSIYNELNTLSDNNKRLDLTRLYTISIDPKGASTLDDAISYDKLKNGNILLYIHLADVNSIVKMNTALDYEAYKRGCTIYLYDNVLPMLPNEISNDKCSLIAGSNKYAVTCEIELDSNYDIVSHNFINTVINVDKNFSYEEVDDVINLNKKDNVTNFLNQLQKISSNFAKTNNKKESYRKLEDMADNLCVGKYLNNINENEIKQTNSHKIISEFMVMVNHLAAEDLYKLKLPYLYRVQEQFDINGTISELESHKKIFENQKLPKEQVQNLLQKTLMQKYSSAYYSKDNIGHHGLGLSSYSHFSSPIRRYSDLLDQRIIKDLLINKEFSDNIVYHYEDFVKEAASELNKKQIINSNYRDEYSKIKFRS